MLGLTITISVLLAAVSAVATFTIINYRSKLADLAAKFTMTREFADAASKELMKLNSDLYNVEKQNEALNAELNSLTEANAEMNVRLGILTAKQKSAKPKTQATSQPTMKASKSKKK